MLWACKWRQRSRLLLLLLLVTTDLSLAPMISSFMFWR